jgi:hypothetical protein
MIAAGVVIGLAVAIATLGLGRDAAAQTVLTGTVKNRAGQPLPGLALLEKGEIHNNVWDRGALVGSDGRFRISLPSGGVYGLHVYASGYIYSPSAVRVETGKTLEMNLVLVPEPTRGNDPVIKKVGFFRSDAKQGRTTFVKAEVTDPNNDLGPQILTFDAGTGRAYAMDPPKRMRDLKANFPNGVYQIEVDTSRGPINPGNWHFVVADHQCNTTDVLSFPHEPSEPKVIR